MPQFPPAGTLEPATQLRPRGPLQSLLALYAPAPAQALLTDPTEIRRALAHWRARMFIGMFVGYAVLYFCRKNISTASAVMATDLGYSNLRLGVVGGSLYVTYMFGKLLNGMLADRANVRFFMATGLIVSGVLNLAFGSLSAVWALALCWGMNGWFQSMGFPPIARAMTLWYPPEGKSTRWAFWTCSHQAGSWAVMAFTAWILTWGSWRACFWIPGLLCVALGVGLLFLLADTPASRGLPSAKAFDDGEEETEGESFWRLFARRVLANRNVWVIGCVDLCVYVVRFGTLDWATKFLIEAKHYPAPKAAFFASLIPAFGIVGVLTSGAVADVVFRARYRFVTLVSLLLLAVCMVGFHEVQAGHPVLDLLLLAGIGFFVEGPQSILGGVGAVDAGGSARVAASAAGVVGFLSYAGATLSSVGTGFLVDLHGWRGAFSFWIACSLLGAILCLVAWREKKHSLFTSSCMERGS